VDSSGNIYIADTSNQRIREVSGSTITTVAGTVSAVQRGWHICNQRLAV